MSAIRFCINVFLAATVSFCFVVTENQDASMWPDISCHPEFDRNLSYSKERGLGTANNFCRNNTEGEKCLKLCIIRKTALVYDANLEEKALGQDFYFNRKFVSAFTFHNFKVKAKDVRYNMTAEIWKCEDAVHKMRQEDDCDAWNGVFKCIEEPMLTHKC